MGSNIFLWPWLRCSEELEQAIFVSSLRNGIASSRRNTYCKENLQHKISSRTATLDKLPFGSRKING
ncbi:7-dien-18-ol synthase TPS06,Dolabella-3 [Trichinella pseudospiralis]